jgi:hypothetical protein
MRPWIGCAGGGGSCLRVWRERGGCRVVYINVMPVPCRAERRITARAAACPHPPRRHSRPRRADSLAPSPGGMADAAADTVRIHLSTVEWRKSLDGPRAPTAARVEGAPQAVTCPVPLHSRRARPRRPLTCAAASLRSLFGAMCASGLLPGGVGASAHLRHPLRGVDTRALEDRHSRDRHSPCVPRRPPHGVSLPPIAPIGPRGTVPPCRPSPSARRRPAPLRKTPPRAAPQKSPPPPRMAGTAGR